MKAGGRSTQGTTCTFAVTPDGIRLYYETLGRGEPLLLVAGRNSDHHIWNMIRADLARRYQVVVYDQRGTGQSDKPRDPPYSTRGFAQDAVAVLDHAGLARAHVYGISKGGQIAQWLGIDHADRIGALVLACTTPGLAHGVRRSADTAALLATGDQPRVLDAFFSRRWTLTTLRFFKSMSASEKSPMPEYASRLHARAGEEHDAWEGLPFITAPTLVLHGGDDPVAPPANARLLADRIPGAELHFVPRGRHMFFIEFHTQVNRLVSDFIARHPPRGGT